MARQRRTRRDRYGACMTAQIGCKLTAADKQRFLLACKTGDWLHDDLGPSEVMRALVLRWTATVLGE